VARELWVTENWTAYLKEMAEAQREAYSDSARYKKYQRYMKKFG
jgi:hypothetical protein